MSEQLDGIERAIGRMEGTLDTHIKANNLWLGAIELRAGNLDKRVRSVEHWRWYLAGALALLGVVGFAFLA